MIIEKKFLGVRYLPTKPTNCKLVFSFLKNFNDYFDRHDI